MPKLNIAIKSGFWFTVCNFIQKGSIILSVPVFTRIMSVDDYGITTVYQSWNAIITILVTMNFSAGVFNNGMIKYCDRRDQFISAIQGLSTTLALLALSAAVLFRKSLSLWFGLPVNIVILMFSSYIFQPAFDYWSAKKKFEYNYRLLLAATIVFTLFSVLVPISAVVCASQKKGIIKVEATILVSIIFTLFFWIYNFIQGKSFFDRSCWKYVLWFNTPLIMHYLANIILGQSDRIMIAKYCGEASSAIYSIAGNLSGCVMVVILALNSAFVPWLYSKLQQADYLNIGDRANKIIKIIGILVFSVISCTPELVKILASQRYYDAVWCVPPVLMGTYFCMLYTLFVNIEVFYEKRIFMTISSTTTAILNIVLNYLFIPIWGYTACAYTTVFCYFLHSVFHYIAMGQINISHTNQKVKHLKIYHIKSMSLICLIFAGLSIIQVLLFDFIIARYLFLAMAVLFFFRDLLRSVIENGK